MTFVLGMEEQATMASLFCVWVKEQDIDDGVFLCVMGQGEMAILAFLFVCGVKENNR